MGTRPPVEPPPTQWRLPDADTADGDGVVAIGADLEPGTLLAAYRSGLFPMPAGRRRIAWFSPDPRAIIPLDAVHVSRSLRRSRQRFEVRHDTRFTDVMLKCADPRRPGGWISPAFVHAYTRLHELGWAQSVECLADDGELVGGLYGVRIERFFAGESMFHAVSDASKVALLGLIERLRTEGAVLLDVQWLTPHLASLGAIAISRREYLHRLRVAVTGNGRSAGGSGTVPGTLG